MRPLVLAGLASMALAAAARAQEHQHQPPAAAPAAADPHAGHVMPAPAPADPHAGHGAPSPSAIPKGPAPAPPTDHIADRDYAPADMAAARALLTREHGGMAASMVMVSLAEHQARDGADGYRWEAEAWYGGDIERLVVTTEGEGTRHEGTETAEVQALYSRAVGPYLDLHAGVRQDIEPRARTYATVGFMTLLPYWVELEGTAFLSTHGDVLGRLEATYDLRLTNRLILQPRAELNFAAQDDRATLTGSGLSNAELGLRLRYEVTRQFAPYIGVSLDRRLGKTQDFVRAAGRQSADRSIVLGLRGFF